jgi:NAD(P)-dependent dehydrogenase (short-subunit alcohol dehydrogenase family)
MKTLADKTILMIGGGVIGRGSVDVLAKAGANIVICDKIMAEAECVAEAVRAHGVASHAVQADAGAPESLHAAAKIALERFGKIDGLYLNAADADAARQDFDILSVEPAVWEQALKINLTGNFHAIRAVLPAMLAAGRGSIVHTASDDAFLGAPSRVGYATSKAGILALSRHVASAYGKKGIRSNVICPGLVPHPEIKEVFGMSMQKFEDEFLAHTPSWRLGKPQDIGVMVRLLMSDEGEWINGQAYSVDGGLVMR